MCFIDPSTGKANCDFDNVCGGFGVTAYAVHLEVGDLRVYGACKGGSDREFCCRYPDSQRAPVSLSLDGTDQVDEISLFHDGEYLHGYDRLDVSVSGGGSGDTLTGSPEQSPLYTEEISGGSGDDTIYGKDGNDTLRGGSGIDTLVGDEGDDVIFGGSETDYIYGNDGMDTLYGQRGHDYIKGGPGDDALYGGADPDDLYGDADNDVCYGGGGGDTLDGGTGDDDLIGGPGGDTLRAGAGDATTAFNRLHGGLNYDTLYGGPGLDVLYGGGGTDEFYGGSSAAASLDAHTGTVFCENGMENATTPLGASEVQVFVGSNWAPLQGAKPVDYLEFQNASTGSLVEDYLPSEQTIETVYTDAQGSGATDFFPIAHTSTPGVLQWIGVLNPTCSQLRSDYGAY